MDFYKFNGLDSGTVSRHGQVLLNFPRLRGFLTNYTPWEPSENFYWPLPDTENWLTPRNVIAEYSRRLLDEDYAAMNKIVRAEQKAHTDSLRGDTVREVRYMADFLDSKIPFPGLLKEWVGDKPEQDVCDATSLAFFYGACAHTAYPPDLGVPLGE